jgi:hypothetical protein
VDAEDVLSHVGFVKNRLKRLPQGDLLVRHLEDVHVLKKRRSAKPVADASKKKKCPHCHGSHSANACWDKFPNLRPQRFGGPAANAAPGAGYFCFPFFCVDTLFRICGLPLCPWASRLLLTPPCSVTVPMSSVVRRYSPIESVDCFSL